MPNTRVVLCPRNALEHNTETFAKEQTLIYEIIRKCIFVDTATNCPHARVIRYIGERVVEILGSPPPAHRPTIP